MKDNKKGKILIIEDDEHVFGALANVFSREQYSVVIAKDGSEGLKTALKEKPDVILLDIIMPKMDGITMLEELRKDPWGAKAKVLVLTNLDNKADMDRCFNLNVCAYFIKTELKLSQLMDKCKELCSL
jgi:DNA-binding response OmpR family regulator